MQTNNIDDFIMFESKIKTDYDSIYFILKNKTDKVLKVSNPKYWLSVRSNLYKGRGFLVPSIKVKPNLEPINELVTLEPYEKFETKFDYTISQIYKIPLKGNYYINFIYRGNLKTENINSSFKIVSNTISLGFR